MSPVLASVSSATRELGSSLRSASRTASEIWSHILSGWPSETDSEVKRKFLIGIKRGSLKCGRRRSGPSGNPPWRNAVSKGSNDLAIRGTVAAQRGLEAQFGLVPNPLWLKDRSL